MDDARAYILTTGHKLVGEPYIWGGDDVVSEYGFDCSGLVHEIVADRAGHWWPQLQFPRTSSRRLFDWFVRLGCNVITDEQDLVPASIVFHRMRGRAIHHVLLHLYRGPAELGCVGLEAGGAGRNAKTPADSYRRGAAVRYCSSTDKGDTEWAAVDPIELLVRS